MLICIDPGHGGKDSGAVYNNIKEKDLNLVISLNLSSYLEHYGFKVALTRDSDATLTLVERGQIAHLTDCDLFISIHCNAFTDSKVSGFEIHYYRDGKEIAQTISDHVFMSQIIEVRSIKKSNFAVLKRTIMPAILIECGFMSNDSDLKKLNDVVFREKLCQSIALGLMALYF